MYTKHKAMGDKIRWRCVQRSTHCKGSIFTSPDFREPRVTVNHNHVPDIDAVEFARCRTMIAERVNSFRIHTGNKYYTKYILSQWNVFHYISLLYD